MKHKDSPQTNLLWAIIRMHVIFKHATELNEFYRKLSLKFGIIRQWLFITWSDIMISFGCNLPHYDEQMSCIVSDITVVLMNIVLGDRLVRWPIIRRRNRQKIQLWLYEKFLLDPWSIFCRIDEMGGRFMQVQFAAQLSLICASSENCHFHHEGVN